jgi:hypothetical protein
MVMQVTLALAAGVLALGFAQQQPVPQPFPRPGTTAPAPSRPAPPPPLPTQPETPPAAPQDPGAPTAETLGMPVYPAATFLRSFDAGMGQRYYLFGTNASFAEIVTYYRTYLRERGNQIFDNEPPTHVFELGRFREETMAYAPGITVKDYTWNGSEGYLHVKAGSAPQRFKTIIQIVPQTPPPAR